MKILVLGSNGQLGRCLKDQLLLTEHQSIFTTRTDLDITDFDVARAKITKIKPDLIINSTAYTAVDKAESDRQEAYSINQHAVANIAQICAGLACRLIHVSTDYVFDGSGTEPYTETGITNPQGVYGDSKLRGEKAIQVSGCQYLIIRSSWIFSEYGDNFLTTMLKLGSKGDELGIVGDQIGCPTYAQDLARCIVRLSHFFLEDRCSSDIFHYCGDMPSSWFDFAQVIFSCAADAGLKVPKSIKMLSTEEYLTPASRPIYSVMNCDKLKNRYKILPSDWQTAVTHVVSRVVSERF